MKFCAYCVADVGGILNTRHKNALEEALEEALDDV